MILNAVTAQSKKFKMRWVSVCYVAVADRFEIQNMCGDHLSSVAVIWCYGCDLV